MNLVGAMRIADTAAPVLQYTLPPLVEVCSGRVALLLDRVADGRILSLLEELLPSVPVHQATREEDDTYCWYHTLQEVCLHAWRMQPDWIIAPDADEVLPYDRLPELLQLEAECIAFHHLYCWGNPETVLTRAVVEHAYHGKCYRTAGRLSPRFTPGRGGLCIPDHAWQCLHVATHPLRHLYVMTEEMRSLRLRAGGVMPRVCHSVAPKCLPFHPDWTVPDYEGAL